MKYEVVIHWDEKDQIYVAEMPELLGCMAHGATYIAALENIQEAAELWTATAKEFDRKIPTPKLRLETV
jgi:predicted RNase H-like HicB family nuclease